MADLFHVIMERAEQAEPIFTPDEIADWPQGRRDHLVKIGLLAEAESAKAILCDSCHADHVEEVVWIHVRGRPSRAFSTCPENGRVQVDPTRLRRWKIPLDALARIIREQIGVSGALDERILGRIWRLGSIRVGGRGWIAWFAVGLRRTDAAAIVESIPELRSPNAVVFVPALPPDTSVWSGKASPFVIPLIDLFTWQLSGLNFDALALESALMPSTRPIALSTVRFPMPPNTQWKEVCIAVEEHHLNIQVAKVVRRFGFADVGFENRKTGGVPNQHWKVLTLLAQFGGALEPKDGIRTLPATMKTSISEIRTRLRALFGMEDDPFHPARASQGYRARFQIRLAGVNSLFPPGLTWDRVTMTEVERGMIAVEIQTETREVSPNKGRNEAKTTFDEGSKRVPIDAFGLKEPERNILVKLLREGRIRAKGTNALMLALGKSLSTFFAIKAPAFRFKNDEWIAEFEALSLVESTR